MEPGPNGPDRDARLLGLALLHGYVESGQLQRAAEENSSPSLILAELRRSGAIDDPCMEGLEQALKSFQSMSSAGRDTGSTHMEPPRHLSETADGGPGRAGSWEDEPDRLDSAARLLRQFTVAQWKQYRNLRFIGEGGMGRIFKAQDPDLKRTVALKFLRGQEPGQLKRFLFEAQAQALMDHPNICRVYEISEWQGQHYIAMQYVNGPTLYRAAPMLNLEEKLRIGEAVAGAVHAAHRRGLIHRDLKPANVLLELGEDGLHKPYVLDFGLAREMEAPGLTASGLVLGTTAYISPEQARGEAHHVDRRTDVYGLGATLYELFAGCPPFGEASGMACIQKVLEEEPPPLRNLAPKLPKDLETVVMKCLEKEPARRYDDAQSLAEDLRRVRESEPIQARRVGLSYRMHRYARRNRAVVVVSAVALVGVLLFGGIAGYTRYAAAVREQHIQHFSQEAERIEALIRIAKGLPAQNIGPHLATSQKRLESIKAEARSAGRHAEGPSSFAIGRAYLALGDSRQALQYLRRAEEVGPFTAELAYTLGKCYGLLYRRELDFANRSGSFEERNMRVREVEAVWKVPALHYLLRSEGSSTEPREFLEAMIESYGSNQEAALGKVQNVARSNPLLYDAKRLEGEILQALAQQKESPAEKMGLLERATNCFTEAVRTAPSDPELHLGLARLHRERVRNARDLGEGSRFLSDCRAAAALCLVVRPEDYAPDIQMAWALAYQAARCQVPRQDPEPLLSEGLALADRALASRPHDPDGAASRIYLLEIRAQARISKGEDPTQVLHEAVNSAKAALAEMPDDPALLGWALQCAQDLLIFEGSNGRNIEPTWALALQWAESYRRLHPQEPYSHLRSATLHIERAEWERVHGRDPRPSIDRALTFYRSGQELGRESGRLDLVMGNGLLIRGQYNLVHGRDATRDLEQAARIYQAWTEKSMPRGLDFGGLAECLLFRGLVELANGQDPSAWIQRSEGAIRKGLDLTEDFWLIQLRGECAWARARWAMSKGSARPYFERAQADLQRAIRAGGTADSHRWMARLISDKALAGIASRQDLLQGKASSQRALALDATCGESYYLAARLAHALTSSPADRRQREAVHAMLEHARTRDPRFGALNLDGPLPLL